MRTSLVGIVANAVLTNVTIRWIGKSIDTILHPIQFEFWVRKPSKTLLAAPSGPMAFRFLLQLLQLCTRLAWGLALLPLAWSAQASGSKASPR